MADTPSSAQRRFYVVSLMLRRKLTAEELQAQRQFIEALSAQGTLILAGIFPDDAGKGMAILCAESLKQALAQYSQAPIVRENIAEWNLKEWRISGGHMARALTADRP